MIVRFTKEMRYPSTWQKIRGQIFSHESIHISTEICSCICLTCNSPMMNVFLPRTGALRARLVRLVQPAKVETVKVHAWYNMTLGNITSSSPNNDSSA